MWIEGKGTKAQSTKDTEPWLGRVCLSFQCFHHLASSSPIISSPRGLRTRFAGSRKQALKISSELINIQHIAAERQMRAHAPVTPWRNAKNSNPLPSLLFALLSLPPAFVFLSSIPSHLDRTHSSLLAPLASSQEL